VKVACLSQLQVQVFHSIKVQVYPFPTKDPDLRHQKCAQIPLEPRINTEIVKKPVILCVKIGLAELEEDVLPLAHLTYAARRTRSVLLSRFRSSGDSCNFLFSYYLAIFFLVPADVINIYIHKQSFCKFNQNFGIKLNTYENRLVWSME